MSLLVFGSANADLVFSLPDLPAPGHTVLGPGYAALPGGKGANQAVAAARDGAATAFAGAVGRDPLAEVALSALRGAGVDLSRLAVTEAPTGCAAICVDPAGRNQIAVASGANLLVRAAQVEDAALTPATTLLLQMEVPAAENAALIRRARARGARIILNLAPALPVPEEVLRGVDWLVMNEAEAQWLHDRLALSEAGEPDPGRFRWRLGCGTIITRGDRGAEGSTAEGQDFGAAACRVDPVLDTTGAGDCWSGVFAAALDRGTDPFAAMNRANAAAAIACACPGAAPSFPRAAETDAMLAAWGRDPAGPLAPPIR